MNKEEALRALRGAARFYLKKETGALRHLAFLFCSAGS